MASMVFGTAGHIDHGKTTLVRAISGHDTDRLPEEKSRGISIELGFADFLLPCGRTAAFVDVPGHERFIRHMVAGVHGMDAVLLVVAVDEGVMPQTLEHLDILGLLGMNHGATILTKADLVDPEWLELVTETTKSTLAHTFLEDAPMLAMDSVSGRGVAETLAVLDTLAVQVQPRSISGFPRMPIDRVFTIRGFGTVVTGTLVAGSLALDEAVVLEPGGVMARIRGLEVHNQAVQRADAGQRVAVNLSGTERAEVARGQVLSSPGALTAVQTLVVELHVLPASARLAMNTAVHCHLGTSETIARLYFYDRDYADGGDTVFAELRLQAPLAAYRGDRFLIRSFSPMVTIGGGTVVELGHPHKRREAQLIERLERLRHASDEQWLEELIVSSGRPLSPEELAAASGLPLQMTLAALRRGDLIQDQERWWYTRVGLASISQAVRRHLEQYHQRYPMRPGMGREELRQRIAAAWPTRSFFWILSLINDVAVDREWVHSDGFVAKPQPQWIPAITELYQAIDQQGLHPQGIDSVTIHWPNDAPALSEIVQWMVNQEQLIRLEEGLYISDRTYHTGLDAVTSAIQRGIQSVADLKDVLQSNRRYTVCFLELLDSRQFTRRVGDARIWIAGRGETPRCESK